MGSGFFRTGRKCRAWNRERFAGRQYNMFLFGGR